jgi:hypothetical protein
MVEWNDMDDNDLSCLLEVRLSSFSFLYLK